MSRSAVNDPISTLSESDRTLLFVQLRHVFDVYLESKRVASMPAAVTLTEFPEKYRSNPILMALYRTALQGIEHQLVERFNSDHPVWTAFTRSGDQVNRNRSDEIAREFAYLYNHCIETPVSPRPDSEKINLPFDHLIQVLDTLRISDRFHDIRFDSTETLIRNQLDWAMSSAFHSVSEPFVAGLNQYLREEISRVLTARISGLLGEDFADLEQQQARFLHRTDLSKPNEMYGWYREFQAPLLGVKINGMVMVDPTGRKHITYFLKLGDEAKIHIAHVQTADPSLGANTRTSAGMITERLLDCALRKVFYYYFSEGIEVRTLSKKKRTIFDLQPMTDLATAQSARLADIPSIAGATAKRELMSINFYPDSSDSGCADFHPIAWAVLMGHQESAIRAAIAHPEELVWIVFQGYISMYRHMFRLANEEPGILPIPQPTRISK